MVEELARLVQFRSRIAIVLAAAAAALSACGCFLGAAQLAPLMIEGAETTASGMIQTTASIMRVAQSPSPDGSDDPNHPGADAAGGGCAQLKSEAPGVIELRTSAAGAPEYRELRPDVGIDPVRWVPLADDETGAEGWHPAVNFLQMGFDPPLAPAIPPAASVFLAYAPEQMESWSQRDHRASLTIFFGVPAGRFTWNHQRYEYVMVNTLPCFPLSQQ